jgi:hypothetical protein
MKARKIIYLFFTFLFCSGCASLHESGKKIWGSSIAHLEKARSTAQSATFALPLDQCFLKVEKILEGKGVLVYLKDKDKKYLAAMNFKGHVDTTEAGVFFTKVEDSLTQVEVSSLSPRLADDAADIVFSGLKTG